MHFDQLTVVCCSAASDIPESLIEKILAVAAKVELGKQIYLQQIRGKVSIASVEHRGCCVIYR